MAHTRKINGIYHAGLRLPSGAQKTITLKTKNKREANSKLARIENLLGQVKLNEITEDEFLIAIGRKRPNEKDSSLKTVTDEFLKQNKGKYRPGTFTKYQNTFKTLLKVCGEDKRVENISSSDYTKLVDKLDNDTIQKENGEVIPRWNNTSINMRLRNLKHFLNWSIENKYLDEIPFKIEQRDPKQYRRYITRTEFDKLLAVIEDSFYKDVFIFVVNTGLRAGEINSSRFENDFLVVDPNKNKTKRGRTLSLPKKLIKIHERILQRGYHKSTYQHRFKDFADLAGIRQKKDEDIKITFHSLRHTFAYRHYFKYGDIYKTSSLLGHSNVNTTQKNYVNNQLNYIENKLGNWDSDDESICLDLAN